MDGIELSCWFVIAVLLMAMVTAAISGNHGPSKWEILLQKCEEQNQLTKDYKVCEKKVLDAKRKRKMMMQMMQHLFPL